MQKILPARCGQEDCFHKTRKRLLKAVHEVVPQHFKIPVSCSLVFKKKYFSVMCRKLFDVKGNPAFGAIDENTCPSCRLQRNWVFKNSIVRLTIIGEEVKVKSHLLIEKCSVCCRKKSSRKPGFRSLKSTKSQDVRWFTDLKIQNLYQKSSRLRQHIKKINNTLNKEDCLSATKVGAEGLGKNNYQGSEKEFFFWVCGFIESKSRFILYISKANVVFS